MRHRTSLSTACAVSLIDLLVWSFAGSRSVVMAQATKAIRAAKSYRFEMLMETDKPENSTTKGTAYWSAPSSYRMEMLDGLRLYAKAFDGEYPRGKMVYGDVTSSALRKKLGITFKTPLNSKEVADFRVAQHGFAHLNTILRDNSDAAWFGKTVTAKNKDKLLLFWKTEDGYQAIFGNLKSKRVSADEFKKIKPSS